MTHSGFCKEFRRDGVQSAKSLRGKYVICLHADEYAHVLTSMSIIEQISIDNQIIGSLIVR